MVLFMYTCSLERMSDKIKTFSTFGDAGHGGITRYSLSYLMSYAAHYADIVILRADNKKQTDAFVNIALNFDASTYKNFVPLLQNKSMTPMIYDVPVIDKFYKGSII